MIGFEGSVALQHWRKFLGFYLASIWCVANCLTFPDADGVLPLRGRVGEGRLCPLDKEQTYLL